MKTEQELYRLLRRLNFFSSYSDKELKKIYKYFQWKSYIEGEVIYKENEPGLEMALILYGEVKVTVIEDNKRTDLAILEEESIIGETSLFNESPRFATIIAYTNCELAVMSKKALDLLIKSEKSVALKFIMQISQVLARRFRDAKIDVTQYIKLYEKGYKIKTV